MSKKIFVLKVHYKHRHADPDAYRDASVSADYESLRDSEIIPIGIGTE